MVSSYPKLLFLKVCISSFLPLSICHINIAYFWVPCGN
eukprot:UN23670